VTLHGKIQVAAAEGKAVTLTVDEVDRVCAALNWAKAMLDFINYEDGETHGGNSILSGLDEEASQ
jgi:hypothetical protein